MISSLDVLPLCFCCYCCAVVVVAVAAVAARCFGLGVIVCFVSFRYQPGGQCAIYMQCMQSTFHKHFMSRFDNGCNNIRNTNERE